VRGTLKGHTGIVNVVRWVPGQKVGVEVIVSGAVDGAVRVWREENGRVMPTGIVADQVRWCSGT
jgi:WD40 repeat protein